MVNRRDLLRSSAALGFAAAIPFSAVNPRLARAASTAPTSTGDRLPAPNALKAPGRGSIPVAFLISEGAVVIDFSGPWEVFENVTVRGNSDNAFRLYTVAETMQPVRASGGMKIVPAFMLATAPAPDGIALPAQSNPNEAVL